MTHTDPIKALVDLKALAEAATPGPWAYEAHGDTMTYGVGVLIDPCGDDDDQCAGEQITGVMIVSEAVAVEVQGQANAAFIAAANPKTILAAIEALKPMADMVMMPSVLLNDIRTIADTGGRRIETAMDACDKIIELIDMERQLGPASPAPSDEGVVERIVKAFERVLLDIDFAIEQGILPDIMNDMIYVEARAALAAINGEK